MANQDGDRITARCPCGAKLKIPAAAAGRKVRCPKCKEVLTVPDLAAVGETIEPAAEPADSPAESLSVFQELVDQERTAAANSSPDVPRMQVACPGCGAAIPGNAALCVQCGYNLETGKQTKAASVRAAKAHAAARKLATGAGGFALGCVLSAVGALIGAAVWAGIAIASEYEIGWIACLIGFLAGGGMVLGYREKNQRAGVVAAGIAVLGIGAARVIMILFILSSALDEFEESREFKEIVLSIHLAQPDYWEQNIPPGAEDPWWELVEQKRSDELAPLRDSDLTLAWETFEEWSSDVKWEDGAFVRAFLINRLSRRGLPDDASDVTPIPLEEWEERCKSATAEVDAMSTEERVERAKDLEIESGVPLNVDELEAWLTDAAEQFSLQGAQEEFTWTELFVGSPIDLLFIGLALVGAFKLASGSDDA